MTHLVFSLALANTPDTEAVYDCIAHAGIVCDAFEITREEAAMRLELRGLIEKDDTALQAALDIYEQMLLTADDTETACELRLSAAKVATELGQDFRAMTHLKYVAMLGPEPYAEKARAQMAR